MTNLPVNHRNASQHLSAERAGHREWIGGRAITLLSHYWRDDDPVELTGGIGADWADVLEGIPREYLQRACIQYQRDEPRRKPTPGAIYQIARRLMPAPEVVETPEPERGEPCSPEVAQAIIEAAGFSPKRFGGE